MTRLSTLALMVLMVVATGVAQTPTITDVSPGAASPGDEITITGVFPITITHTRFTASVGGFLGIDNRIVAVTSATATQVKVTVPTMAGFAPPLAAPPGNPMGTLAVRDAGGIMSSDVNFFYNQGAFQDPNGTILEVQSNGLGGTNSLGCRAAASFDIASGPPNTAGGGNPAFTVTLENATPFSNVVLAAGSPANPPSIMVGNGLLGIDLGLPVLVFPPVGFLSTNANGELFLPAGIPPGGPFNSTATLVFAYFDAGSGAFQISTGLTLRL